MLKVIDSGYQEAQEAWGADGNPERLVWKEFKPTRSSWKPIDYAIEFDLGSIEDDEKEVRKSRSEVSPNFLVPRSTLETDLHLSPSDLLHR